MSWFSRKPKNRRLNRGHVLDVKLRSDQVRASRLRLGTLALGLLVATLLGFYFLWRVGDWALDCLLYKNSAFALQKIDVRTDGVIATNQLSRWAGVKLGQNLLALDLARVKRDLEMVSTVRSVAVERIMPHTLRLRVSEREPVARFLAPRRTADGGLETGFLQLDAEGYVMAPLDPRQLSGPPPGTNDILPLITGVDPNEAKLGQRISSRQVRQALQLIAAFDTSAMAGQVDLTAVDVTAPEVLQAITAQQAKITFALSDLDRQLRQWRVVYDEAQRQAKAISTLDLSVNGNVPAILIEARLMPAIPPKPKTPLTTRRRNV